MDNDVMTNVFPTPPTRIAVGMSGGVDSTVAAWLLVQAGHKVVGLTMQIWDGSVPLPDEGRSGCFGPGEARDLAAARSVAERLGIRHVSIPLAAEYRHCVLDYFRAEYRAGRTPNPCVVCNRAMKFGLLWERARAQGIAFDGFATGHYARVTVDPATGRCRLLRGVDAAKDQSYFLARLTQDQLRQTRFPLGGMTKREVVALARDAGFGDIAERDESQEFIESADYTPLFEPGDARPGPIVDTTGRVVGQNAGLIRYTVGQRTGLGIAAAQRLYVKALQPDTNTVVVGRRDDVLSAACRVADLSWVAGHAPAAGTACRAQLRYRHPGVAARLFPEADGAWRVAFGEPQFAVAPGQAAAFYDGDEVLGSGWIAAGGDVDYAQNLA